MQGYSHVLVPTDFSAHAEHAQELAIMFASKFGAKMTLLHAYSIPLMAYSEGIAWPIEDVEREARKALDAAGSKVKERYARLETSLRFGHPWEQILAAVKDLGVDLIVMGTHGRRGLSRALLGSVAEKVVRLSPVPVLTVPLTSQERGTAQP